MTKANWSGKLSHFWYYYKWLVIVIALTAAIFIFFTVQCATRTQADYSVVLYLNQSVGFEQRIGIQEMLAKSGEDINGDGQVIVEVFDVSFDDREPNINIISANRIKAMGQMSLSNSMIYITDSTRFPEYQAYGLFQPLDWLTAQDGYAWNWAGSELQQTLSEFGLPENLYFSLRQVKGTAVEKDAGTDERLAQSKKLLYTLIDLEGAQSCEGTQRLTEKGLDNYRME